MLVTHRCVLCNAAAEISYHVTEPGNAGTR
uniref:Uncharacterized protein n=1 Tax=Arundo donax TaxID=35708 RepID=A0A0A8Y1M8_ARUDO